MAKTKEASGSIVEVTQQRIEVYDEIERIAGDPFGKDIATAELFEHGQLRELREMIRTSVVNQLGMLITGPAGSGKTTALRSVTDELPSNKYAVSYLGQDRDGTNVLRRFVGKLGLTARHHHAHLSLQVSQWLQDNLEAGGKNVVLVVDEAHLLPDSLLEDLRLMTNADYDQKSPLTLILLGHHSLRMRLKAPDFDALFQRLRYRFRLEGFNLEETTQYISRRLIAAGLSPHIFTDDSAEFIFHLSEGLPRRINNICSLALLKAKTTKRSKVDLDLLKEMDELD